MSTAVSDAGGVVIISQVGPQNYLGNGPEEGETCDAPARMPKAVLAFYHGEPEVLGTTQIFTGIVLMSYYIVMAITNRNHYFHIEFIKYSGVPIWSGIMFIISGSLSVATSVKPTVRKVKSSLVMNIFTSLAAAGGIIVAATEVSIMLPLVPIMRLSFCTYYKGNMQCNRDFSPMHTHFGYALFNLILFVLMFCISISTSVFACRTVCRSSFQEINVVIYQTTSSSVSDPTIDVPPDSTAAFTTGSKIQA